MQQDSVSGVNDESVDSVLPVEPLSFPLHGSRLIEASAGTGKTFTIAALYLRLVLGHGNDGGAQRGFSRPLDPPEILVVTFTEAATLELRDRIRARLSEAAAHFRLGVEEQLSAGRPLAEDEEWGEQESAPGAAGVPGDRAVPAGKSVDAYLAALRDSYPADTWAACAARLQLAAEWMDEAAVSTIHGWCSRMLREHAFDSGSLFTQNPAENDAELRAEAFRDYWRSFVQQFDRDDARIFAGWWADFDAFRKQIDGNLSRLLAVEGDAITPAQAITQLKTALDALKQPWRDEGWAAALKERLLQACDKKHVNGSKLRKDTVIKRMDALLHWANTDGLLWPVEGRDSERPMDWGKSRADSDPVPWLQKNLSADAFADRTIWKDPQLTDHPAFAEISALPGQLRALERFKAGVLRHAARWVDERHRLAREQRSELGFDDMLHQLDRALQAEGGEVLAHRIRQQFPVALIDEFQDTDPLQYRIFDSVYRVGDAGVGALTTDVLAEPQTVDGGNGQQGAWRSQAAADDGQTALILIGDPKQAIYAFRDADIHTYLRARRATRGRHYTLDRNFRSSTAMVEAVNHLFRTAEEREGSRGAFRFAREGRNPVPFMPVKAAGRRDAWWDRDNGSDGVAPALTLWQPPVDDADASLGKETYEARFSAATANEIARLLRAGQQRSAGFGDNRWVRPADIAVLVNNYRQANLVRKALQGHGIPSVYLSDKESVYDSGVADDLLRFLMACADPGDGALVRSALGSRLAGLRPEELIELRQDEMRWEERVADFQRYRQIWRQKGVLPMVRHLLQDFRVTERLLMAGRERELTDVLHLAELLQQASAVLDGEQALIRHFREQRLNPSGDADSRRQRLESDDERVRVVTVHKSKGLEYPLVFIPFFCDVREVDGKALVLSSHDEHGQPRHVLNLEDDSVEEGFSERGDALAAADEERLGEDLRKLYVALTRARHATWIGFDALKTLPASAAGHLLGYQAPGEGADAADSDGMGEGAAQEAGASAHRKGGKKAKESPEEKRARQAAEVRAARQALADCVSRMLAGARAGEMVVRVPPVDAPGEPLHLADEDVHWKDAPALPATRWQPWWIASYSALLLRQARQGGDIHYTESAREDNWLEDVASLRVAESDGADVPVVAKVRRDGAAEDGGPDISMHGFPRGPRPGSFLHGLLEWAGQQGFARLSALPVLLEDEIARRLDHQPDWQPWQAVLGEWLGALLGRPIIRGEGGQKRMALADLSVYQVEMNFMLPVTDVNVPRLDAWACRHSFGGQPRPALSSGTLNGMLKGVIDLVFEHDGRYFVLDYKSNWLGGADADYAQENMQAVMLHHRYDLQLIFYVLALHRLLKSRLPDYDYDRHVGGAIYLFMRGIDADTGGIFPARPDRRMIETLDAMFRGELSLSSPHPEDLGEALA